MSLNGKAPQLFPFQRGEGGSIPSISIQGSSTFNNNQRKEEALLTCVSSISLDTSTQKWVLFCLEIIMRNYKNWGTVSSGAELHMLAHAERTRKELERERKVIQRRLPRATKTNKR